MTRNIKADQVLLSIIIVNYNVADEIINCINTIFEFYKGSYEIIVVDNNSIDRRIDDLPKIFNSVKFVFLDSNYGFSKANNVGVENSKGIYILILNPDTVFVQDCITEIIDFLESNENVGAATPMLLNRDMSYQYSAGYKRGLWLEIVDSSYILIKPYEYISSFLFNKKIKKGLPFSVLWISGAFMIMKANLYKELGGFDTSYKLNYEDMDLCGKIRMSGKKILYFPKLKCIHLESISQKKSLYNYIYERYRGRIIYFQKNANSFSLLLIKIFQIIGLILRMSLTPIIFPKEERKQRINAFKDSLKLYLGLKQL
jgi:GT2 family glycosyltransferase